MRHYRHRKLFRFYFWHGLRFRLGNRHSHLTKQQRRFGRHGHRRIRRLWFEQRYVKHQPKFQFIIDQPQQQQHFATSGRYRRWR
jgi:hypothetical protein